MSKVDRWPAVGFTVIEMLIAMAIFSALVSVLMMGFRQGVLLWEHRQHRASLWQEWEHRQDWISVLFSQAIAADYIRDVNDFLPVFQGEKNSVMLITAAPVMSNAGEIKRVEMRFERGDDGFVALRYREYFPHDEKKGDAAPKWVTLLDRLSDGTFRYEAPIRHYPPSIDASFLTVEERKGYREAPEWLDDYAIETMVVMPRRIEIRWKDAEKRQHIWRFMCNAHTDAWPLVYYFGT